MATLLGDGDAMRVACQVMQHVLPRRRSVRYFYGNAIFHSLTANTANPRLEGVIRQLDANGPVPDGGGRILMGVPPERNTRPQELV
jgi:hypothetical protein